MLDAGALDPGGKSAADLLGELGRDPDFLLASSVNGEVFSSTDAGDSWSKFAREFGEVHALIWAPELALDHSAGIGKSRPTG